MRDIDPDIIAQLEAEGMIVFQLLEMYIDSVYYRYADCDVPIMAGSYYEPRSFKPESIQYGLNNIVDQMKVDVDNLDDALTSVFVGGTPQDSEVSLKLVALDTDYSVIASPQTRFEGFINGWGLTEEKVSITVSSLFNQWAQKTLSKHSASCRWKVFKGTECGYTGSGTWCDRSYTRCSALGNTDNFGGFRWLPSIVDKELWWGTSRAI